MTPEIVDLVDRTATAVQALRETLRRAPSGLEWCHRYSAVLDESIIQLFNNCFEGVPSGIPFALLATGGFGRREMSPGSDVDLMVVSAGEDTPDFDPGLRRFFTLLTGPFRERLGIEVDYSYLYLSQIDGIDITTRTALLEARFLVGRRTIPNQLRRSLVESMPTGDFLLEKLRERTEQHAQHHRTPLVAEPNLKEGAGGLRCFHAANWIREALGEQALAPTDAYDQVLQARNLLHLLSQKSNDNLTRSRQGDLAELLGIHPTELMISVTKAGEELHHGFLRTIQKVRESRFVLTDSCLAIRGEIRIRSLFDGGSAAVGVSLGTALGLEIEDLKVGIPKSVNGPALIHAVSTGSKTLRAMDRCGLLERLLPELTATRFLVPTDAAHRYTIFEHLLKTVENLDSVTEPFLQDIKALVADGGVLYFAALLHDIGKIDLDQPHELLGGTLLRELSKRLSIPPETAEELVWLVENHLVMTRFIRIRDVNLEETIRDFAEVVKTTDRLNMLTLLTWADVNAVGAGTWTPSQDTFLRMLYERTFAYLSAQSPERTDPSVYRRRLLAGLKHEVANESLVQTYLDQLPVHYLTTTPPEVVKLHMKFVEKARREEVTIEIFERPEISATEVTVCAPDRPGLLSEILGVFYAHDLSVPGIRASTTTDSQPIAIDVFQVSRSDRPVPAATMSQVSKDMQAVLLREKSAFEILVQKGKDPNRLLEVDTVTYQENRSGVVGPGVLELRCPRGRGLPFRISSFLARQGWTILTARLGQYAGKAASAYYLLDETGRAPTAEAVQKAFESLRSPTADQASATE